MPAATAVQTPLQARWRRFVGQSLRLVASGPHGRARAAYNPGLVLNRPRTGPPAPGG